MFPYQNVTNKKIFIEIMQNKIVVMSHVCMTFLHENVRVTCINVWWYLTLGMDSANERLRYNVTSSLIGWAHTQNDPYTSRFQPILHGHIQNLCTWFVLGCGEVLEVRGVKIHRVSRHFVIQTSRYVSWYEKISQYVSFLYNILYHT